MSALWYVHFIEIPLYNEDSTSKPHMEKQTANIKNIYKN